MARHVGRLSIFGWSSSVGGDWGADQGRDERLHCVFFITVVLVTNSTSPELAVPNRAPSGRRPLIAGRGGGPWSHPAATHMAHAVRRDSPRPLCLTTGNRRANGSWVQRSWWYSVWPRQLPTQSPCVWVSWWALYLEDSLLTC